MSRPTVAQCVEVFERAYEPATAESWDAVGLSVGDPAAPVERVLLAVDPTEAVAREAVEAGAQLLVTHHPLFLRGVHGVAETEPGGRVVTTLVRGGCALFSAHTNADVARPGVSDALAAALGLVDTLPLAPRRDTGARLDRLSVLVPVPDRDRLLDALAAAGAGSIGDYDRCAWWTDGTGTFRPLEGAHPTIGTVGEQERVDESRLVVVSPRSARTAVLAALRSAHPYEEPAFDLVAMVDEPVPGERDRGLGRVGDLPRPERLRDLIRRIADVLPSTACGVRGTGDPDREVARLAVCGGAGGELAGAAAALGAHAFLTADGRHHHVLDAVAAHDLAVVDAAHWATEWPWLGDAVRVLLDGLLHGSAGAADDRLTLPETVVSTIVTDPWRVHAC